MYTSTDRFIKINQRVPLNSAHIWSTGYCTLFQEERRNTNGWEEAAESQHFDFSKLGTRWGSGGSRRGGGAIMSSLKPDAKWKYCHQWNQTFPFDLSPLFDINLTEPNPTYGIRVKPIAPGVCTPCAQASTGGALAPESMGCLPWLFFVFFF